MFFQATKALGGLTFTKIEKRRKRKASLFLRFLTSGLEIRGEKCKGPVADSLDVVVFLKKTGGCFLR